MTRSNRFVAALLPLSLLAVAGCGGSQPHHSFGGLPASIASAVSQGGPNPSDIAITLGNPGNCALGYSIATATVDGAPWLTVTPASGSVAAGAAQSLDVSLDVVTTNLAPGTYTGTITVSGTCASNGRPADGSPGVVGVNLTVKGNRAGIVLGTTVIGQDVVTLANQWSPLALGPSPRAGTTVVWTGDELIVWGGDNATAPLGDGQAYDPTTQLWSPISADAAPSARVLHAALWTGSKMLVWGGSTTYDGTSVLTNTGALYDPVSDSWTPTSTTGAPAGRNRFCAVWAGSIGKAIVWGGTNNSGFLASGALYDPSSDSWTAMAASPLTPRESPACAWTGSRLVIWGGGGPGGLTPGLSDGASYDPSTNSWTSLSHVHAPTARVAAASVFTGTKFLVWGGFDSGTYRGDGGAYDVAHDKWTAISTVGAPSARDWFQATGATWTGSRMIVWGGWAGSAVTNSGGVYDPVADSWTATSLSSAPSGRTTDTQTWIGDSAVVFGGTDSSGALSPDAGIYR